MDLFTNFMKTVLLKAKLYTALLLLGAVLQACQEEEDIFVQHETAETQSMKASSIELTMDSLFLYAKEVYLWNKDLPEYTAFSPRKYAGKSPDLEGLKKELFDITQYSLNPASGRAYEFVSSSVNYPKYSFIEEKESAAGKLTVEGISGMTDLEGSVDDFGLAFSAVAANDIRIRYVNTGSPAAKAGLSRGDALLKINGSSVRADTQAGINQILSSLEGASLAISVKKANGTVIETTLTKSTYTVDPVFKSQVLSTEAGKVGYIAYSMFSSMSNSKAALEKAFTAFAAAGVTNLVLDLRYNGGGYVSTAEYLCNQIAPAGLNGKIMYKEIYNELMQQGQAKILSNKRLLDGNDKPIPYKGRYFTYGDLDYSVSGNTHAFKNEGALETVKNVYIIIGGRTASASELVINALKPHMHVTLIGSASYGKPVGFFGIDLDKYTVYMPNFKTVNASNEGDYYSGFTPDVAAPDDVSHDFGDPKETSLSMALNLIASGSAMPSAKSSRNGGKNQESIEKEVQLQHLGDDTGFQGMIENRKNVAY
jgi:carboxyl-terminal processing protease